MERYKDLTEIVNGRMDAERLNAALFQRWELEGRSRYEASVTLAAERQLRRRMAAESNGVGIRFAGE